MATFGAMRPSLGPMRLLHPSALVPPSSSSSSLALFTQARRPLCPHRAASPAAASAALVASFSTSTPLLKRPPTVAKKPGRTTRQGRHRYEGARRNGDNSKGRGESSLRQSGLRRRSSVSAEPLPRPVAADELPAVETAADHGLWEFFHDRRTVVNTPAADAQHGREWTVEELRAKSWDDLHRLWWVCVKERNRIATADWEREKQKLGFGEAESRMRDIKVRLTMRNIKHALTERYYAWEDATKLAKQDPEIEFGPDGVAYQPQEYLEDEQLEVEEEEARNPSDAQSRAEVDPVTLPSAKSSGEQAARV